MVIPIDIEQMGGWMDGWKNREPSMCPLELAVELTLFNLQVLITLVQQVY